MTFEQGDRVAYDENEGVTVQVNVTPGRTLVCWDNGQLRDVYTSDLVPAPKRPHLAAVARPGDTVIIAFEGELSQEDIAQLEQGFEYLTRKGIEVAFTDQVRSMVVVSEAGDRLTSEEEADHIDDWGGA